MGDTYVVDITHYLLPGGILADGPAGRTGRYFGSIVSAASVQSPGVWVTAALECRRRPGRMPCAGWIRLRRRDEPPAVEWHCTSCDDNGIISNWQQSMWDLSRWVKDTNKKPPLKVPVSLVELRELRRMVAEPENQALIAGAVVVDGYIFLQGRGEDLDDLLDCLAFEANHESSTKRRDLLDRIADRIEPLLCLWRTVDGNRQLSLPEGADG